MAREILSWRIQTPDGWQEVPQSEVILHEPQFGHFVRKLPDGNVAHYFHCPIVTVEKVSPILLARAGVAVDGIKPA